MSFVGVVGLFSTSAYMMLLRIHLQKDEHLGFESDKFESHSYIGQQGIHTSKSTKRFEHIVKHKHQLE